LALLQLDVTQDYLIGRIEQQVNQNFEEQLSIGEVGGFRPFNFTLQDVVLTQDSTETDTLAYVASIQNNLDIWSLFQNKIGVNGFELNQPEVWLDRKSTRLNSSHVSISYAVFCLKKKNTIVTSY